MAKKKLFLFMETDQDGETCSVVLIRETTEKKALKRILKEQELDPKDEFDAEIIDSMEYELNQIKEADFSKLDTEDMCQIY